MTNPVTVGTPTPTSQAGPTVSDATSTATVTGQDAISLVEQNYPAEAWMLNVPELAQVIINIAQQQITDPNTIQAMMEGTNWWKTQSDAARTFFEQEMTDPATWGANLQAQEQSVQATFSQLGLKPTQAQINSFAYESLLNGWTTQELTNHVAKAVQINPDGSFQVATYYIDPATGKAIDVFTGRQAYYGPQGQPATPQKPTNMAGWSEGTFNGQTVYYQTNSAPWQTKVGNTYIDTTTGRKAYYGPGGEPGTPDQQAAIQAWGAGNFETYQRDDGTTIYYKPGAGATAASLGPNTAGPGMLQSTVQSLQADASNYLVPISQQTLAQWSQQINAGLATQQGFDSYLKEQAKSLFPSMAAAIDAGITPYQYVDPYRQVTASVLGVDPNSINFLDPKWSRSVTQKDPKTGMPTAMSLWDWQKTLMQDPTYGYQQSQNGVSRAAAFADALGTMFGKTPSGGSGFSGIAPVAV